MKYFEMAENDCDRIKRNILIVNDRNFFGRIIERGKEYFEQGKVTELKKINDNMYSAEVLGTEKYNIKVTMNGKFCRDADCSCPFNVAEDDYINPKLCKHIYATYLAIYELENKEYLKNAMTEYSEKYSSIYLEIISKIDNLKLNSKDNNLCKKYKNEFTEIYKNTQNTFTDELTSQMILNLLCRFIVKSAEILDLLEKINTSYEDKLIEENIEDEDINEDIMETEENEKITESKESFIIKLFKILGAIIVGIFAGLASSSETENTSEEENTFSHGDTVIVKYSGKVGVIVSVSGNYYTVKLKDEFENEYYASYYGNELENY